MSADTRGNDFNDFDLLLLLLGGPVDKDVACGCGTLD
jgi:hypothetical protein